MNKAAKAVLCCLFISFLADISTAREWRGIIPLHSTRENVRKLLGKPLSEDNLFDHYRFKGEYVNIQYATEPCLGLPYYWGNYNVAAGTVLTIEVSFEHGIPLADLKIPNIEKQRRAVDDSATIYYFDKEQGIEYSVQDGKVVSIEYGASAADKHLRCAEDGGDKH